LGKAWGDLDAYTPKTNAERIAQERLRGALSYLHGAVNRHSKRQQTKTSELLEQMIDGANQFMSLTADIIQLLTKNSPKSAKLWPLTPSASMVVDNSARVKRITI
jgi:hypothetical protein